MLNPPLLSRMQICSYSCHQEWWKYPSRHLDCKTRIIGLSWTLCPHCGFKGTFILIISTFLDVFFQIPEHMKNAKVSQLQPMSISVQSGDTTSANTVSSTSKIDNNPRDGLNKDNPQDCAQKNAPEQNVKKTKTIQHLLSDWRTAYAMSKKVIVSDLSSYLILSYLINLFSGNNCWEHSHFQFISIISIQGSM